MHSLHFHSDDQDIESAPYHVSDLTYAVPRVGDVVTALIPNMDDLDSTLARFRVAKIVWNLGMDRVTVLTERLVD